MLSNSKNMMRIKAELLSKGVNLDESLIKNFNDFPYLKKRRAYGNQDPSTMQDVAIPQELLLTEDIVCAVNIRESSPWNIMYISNEFELVNRQQKAKFPVTFTQTPEFYEKAMKNGCAVNKIITLYGGKTLAIFVYGNCSLIVQQHPCHYCSLANNKERANNFRRVVRQDELKEALMMALENSPSEVDQIMLNGGNFPDADKNFCFYLQLVDIVNEVLGTCKRKIELHLIIFPPKNLELLQLLLTRNVKISMNLEIYDEALFKKYCPGKHAVLGQKNLLKALSKAVDYLGNGNVYSILVGGIESLTSLNDGLVALADLGVVPVINVFHPDPGTPLANHVVSTDTIMSMGKYLQDIYAQHAYMRPFYFCCGRNSLDTEAFYKLF